MNKPIHPWQKPAKIKRWVYSKNTPVWSMVMPVFNQEYKLNEILEKIQKNAFYPFEMLIINDASDDDSVRVVKKFCEAQFRKKNIKVVQVTLIDNPTPLYETACDNQGFKIAKSEFIIEIQSDIHIEEKNFDRKMIEAFEKFSLGALSGRHVHAYSMIEGRQAWFKYPIARFFWRTLKFESFEGVGRLGNKIFERVRGKDNFCYIGETVARGPWLIRKSDLEKLSYLDENFFFLGNDDHDYHRRLYKVLGKLAGYLPMDIYSISEDGATRRPRVGVNKKIFEYLKKNKKGSPEFKKFMRWYRPFRSITKHPL